MAVSGNTVVGSIWRNRDFLLLWIGQSVSMLGSRVSQFAFPLLVLAVTGSPAQAGLVSALGTLPYLLVTLPAGALVDRWDRRRIMLLCDLGRAVALGSIPLAFTIGSLSWQHLAVVAMIDGALSTFFSLAHSSALPHVVDRRQLSQALSAASTTDQASQMVGPLIGGLLYTLGRGLPFLVDAVSYVVSGAMLMGVRRHLQGQAHAPSGKKIWHDVRDGIHWLWKEPMLRFLLGVVGTIDLCSYGYTLIMVVLAQELGATPFQMGVLFATGGVGGILGALVTPWLHARLRFGTMLLGVIWVWVLTWPPYAFAPNLWVLGVVNIVGWVLVPMLYVTEGSYRMTVVPDAFRGRVNSVWRMLTIGLQPVSVAITGWMLGALGPTWTILLSTIPQAVAAIAALLYKPLRESPKLAEIARDTATSGS